VKLKIKKRRNNPMEKTAQDKVIFYYIRDYQKRPVITVCLIRFNGIWSRGVAICSDKDMPSKKEGRMKAFGRAEKATRNQEHSELIGNCIFMWIFLLGAEFIRKSEWNAILTVFEQRLVEKCNCEVQL
jgi:hypothetical protein